MENYIVSPEDCLILRAFSRSSSLREAARLLSCDPAKLVRKVQILSKEHDLLCKINGRWKLTSSGQTLVSWTDESILSQNRLLRQNQSLRIAVPSWFAEQILIPKIQWIQNELSAYRDLHLFVPSSGFESALKAGEVDLVIASHPPEDPIVAHKKIITEKWILVAPASWRMRLNGKSHEQIRAFLSTQTFIRHTRLTRDSLSAGFDNIAHSSVEVDFFIGAKAAVVHEMGWSCMPRFLVQNALKKKELIEVDLPIAIQNDVSLWWLRNRHELKKVTPVFEKWVSTACRED